MAQNSNLNILGLVSYNFLPAKMGGQKGIASFYEFYAKRVHLTCVCTESNDPSTADYEVLNILSNSPLRYINLFYFFTLKKIIETRSITHVQIEHPYWGWLGVLVQKYCKVKLIVHSHNIESLRFKSIGKSWWRILWVYERWVHRAADFNLFISDEDRNYAIQHYAIDPQRCITATYGIDWDKAPSVEDKMDCKSILLRELHLPEHTLLMLFNGTFSYLPNLAGLRQILTEINPILSSKNLKYAIIICGKNIPLDISEGQYPNVFIEGFVDDISIYFKGVDVFLNPLSEGGGIKTKLVEAIGYNLFAISYSDGAIGIPKSVSENVLFVVEDSNQFANKIVSLNGKIPNVTAQYFQHFYWGNIVDRVINFLKN